MEKIHFFPKAPCVSPGRQPKCPKTINNGYQLCVKNHKRRSITKLTFMFGECVCVCVSE